MSNVTSSIPAPKKKPGRKTKWTPERVQELREYVEQNGVEAAMKEFHISKPRIYQIRNKYKPHQYMMFAEPGDFTLKREGQ